MKDDELYMGNDELTQDVSEPTTLPDDSTISTDSFEDTFGEQIDPISESDSTAEATESEGTIDPIIMDTQAETTEERLYEE